MVTRPADCDDNNTTSTFITITKVCGLYIIISAGITGPYHRLSLHSVLTPPPQLVARAGIPCTADRRTLVDKSAMFGIAAYQSVTELGRGRAFRGVFSRSGLD